MFKHILIPTDGSPTAHKAVKAGIRLAKEIGARVTAYHAIEELPAYFSDEGYSIGGKALNQFERLARERAQARVDAVGKAAKAAGVPFDAVVSKVASPHAGIIETAKRRRCDVIFMASHGRRGVSKLVMGSVTQKVLTHTRIPVLVFR